MTIKNTMLILILTLSFIAMASQMTMFYKNYNFYKQAVVDQKGNEIVGDLIKMSIIIGEERGSGTLALARQDASGMDTQNKLSTLREKNAKLLDTLEKKIINAGLVFEDRDKSELSTLRTKLDSVRITLDKEIALPKSARDEKFARIWASSAAEFITSLQGVRASILTQALNGYSRLGKTSILNQALFRLSDNSGRAAISVIISNNLPLSATQIEQISSIRNRIKDAWNTLESVSLNAEEHQALDSAIANAKANFMVDYQSYIDKITEEGKKTGDNFKGYGVSVNDFFARATSAIDSVNALLDAALKYTENDMDAILDSVLRSLVMSGVLFAFCAFSAVVSLWVLLSRVIKPVNILADSMKVIAGGNYDTQAPFMERTDEIGNMAKSVEVFRENGIEKIKLEKEAKENEVRAKAAQKASMEQLAKDFEESLQGIINSVASASTELFHTAKSMQQTVSSVGEETKNASASSAQTSGYVQSVSSAVEEMSSSIKEIASQVTQSYNMVSETVSKTNKATETGAGLSKAVAQIGGILDLITTIASQINLLSLNATIEAARAGDAGKGFTVVAGEVKILANQVAKATEEISKEIANMQAASDEVVSVISAINGDINNINVTSSKISVAVEEQSAVTNNISSNMASTATSVVGITQNIDHIMKGANNADNAAKEVLESSQLLSKQSELLNQKVASFLEKIRA